MTVEAAPDDATKAEILQDADLKGLSRFFGGAQRQGIAVIAITDARPAAGLRLTRYEVPHSTATAVAVWIFMKARHSPG